jgi:undecaprenyl-phosphate 4-deoxy-4-formamido-L-arabinose transferase
MSDAAHDKKAPSAEAVLCVIVPVLDGEAALTGLFDRLYPVLDGLGQPYEVVFVDNGSRDRSATLLRQQHRLRPDTTRVIGLRGKLGVDGTLRAGLDACSGRRIVTLGADLQDPPEEIPRLVAELDRGHDYVGTIRRRQDPPWRRAVVRLANGLREQLTGIGMADPGSGLRAYDREVLGVALDAGEAATLVSAFAWRCAADPTEIPVEPGHDEKQGPGSPLYEAVDLNLQLLTRFSLLPLRVFSLAGMGSALAALAVAAGLALRWLILGPAGEGLVGLLALLFLFVGVILFGVGLLGGYLGLILDQVRGRPQRLVREELPPRPASRRPRG